MNIFAFIPVGGC